MEGGAKESQGGRQRREEATGELLPLSATAQCRSLPCLHLLPTVAALASPRHCWSSFFPCHNGHFFQLHHATGCTLLLATVLTRPVGLCLKALLPHWHSNVHLFNCNSFNRQSAPITELGWVVGQLASGGREMGRSVRNPLESTFNKGNPAQH